MLAGYNFCLQSQNVFILTNDVALCFALMFSIQLRQNIKYHIKNDSLLLNIT